MFCIVRIQIQTDECTANLFGCCTELDVASLTMARGTMPARSSCASRISVSASCVVARLAGYSTCQAIQRLPSGSGKLSIFRSTWSTLWTPISDLPESRKWSVSEWLSRWLSESLKRISVCRCGCSCVLLSSFNLLSALMTTNGKSWWMCLVMKSMTFYQPRILKMSSPFVFDSLVNSWNNISPFLYSSYTLSQVRCTVNRTSNLMAAPQSSSKESVTGVTLTKVWMLRLVTTALVCNNAR